MVTNREVLSHKGSSIKDVSQVGGGGSDLFSKVYIGQRGEGVKYWQNSADVLYGWPLIVRGCICISIIRCISIKNL